MQGFSRRARSLGFCMFAALFALSGGCAARMVEDMTELKNEFEVEVTKIANEDPRATLEVEVRDGKQTAVFQDGSKAFEFSAPNGMRVKGVHLVPANNGKLVLSVPAWRLGEELTGQKSPEVEVRVKIRTTIFAHKEDMRRMMKLQLAELKKILGASPVVTFSLTPDGEIKVEDKDARGKLTLLIKCAGPVRVEGLLKLPADGTILRSEAPLRRLPDSLVDRSRLEPE